MGCATSKPTPRATRQVDPYLIPKPEYHPAPTVPQRQSRPTEYNHPTPQVTPYSSDERPRVVISSHQDDSAPPSPSQSAYATTITTTNSRPTTTAARPTPSVPGAHPISGPAPSPTTPFNKTPHHPVPLPPTPNTNARIAPFTATSPVVQRTSGFDETYIRGKKLGSGAFAQVFIATHRSTQNDFAVKCVDRAKMQWGDRDALQDELENLRHLKEGPNIVQLFSIYTPNQRECYMVMELLQGGELFERILQKKTFTEAEARDVARGLLSALSYMHAQNIAHRDLKPENLLLVNKESDTDIKLADFGFAKKVLSYNGCRTLCGTPGYMAPEILERFPAYGTKCDLWSTGVILFVLLGGYLPFDDDTEDGVFNRTRNAQYEFYPDYWNPVSASAKNLVVSMLTINPTKRISAHQALDHEWMRQSKQLLVRRKLSSVVTLQQERNRAKKQDDPRHEKKVAAFTANAHQTNADRMRKLNDAFNSYMTRQDDDTATVFSAPPVKRAEPVEDSAKGFPFKHYYKLGETLGEGGFGKVKRAEHKKLHETRAVKIINKTKLECHGLESLKDEISALKLLRGGPHIVRLFDVFEEQRYTYIIMEEMKGGELLRRIVDKEVYTEREARAVCRILFSAIDYCHKFKIAHRDLKPENLLLQDVSDDTSIKIADFGFAKRVRKPNSLTTLCGTANYIAPEVLDLTSPGYDERADIWSCGVIMYVLLGGYQPFQGPIEELANKIQRGEYKFHNEYWMYTSPSAKNLISSCLRVNPKDRITADEALASDWMNTDEETLTGNDLTVAQHKIREGLPIDKLKGAVYTVMLTNKMTSLEEKFTSTLGDRRAFENRQRKNAAKPAAVATSGSAPAPTTPEAAPAPVAHANILMTISEESTGGSKLFGEVYSLGGAFGSGSFSVVHEAVQRHTTEEVAVKVVDRRQLNPADAVRLQDEIVALRELVACPHIVELYDVFDEPDTTFLVMERMRGGELIERIIKRAHYTEADARAVCRNLLLGVQFCHSKSIANRNLKPENLLLSTEGSDVDVKISDFGCAKKVLYPNSLRTQCGTEGYTAPEILEHRPEYDVPCDMWSLGVVLYILIGGYRPFRGSGTEIMRQIRYGEYEFHEQYWNHVSREAKDLIKRMMTVHPVKRITAAEALESDWMVADDSTLQSDLSPNQTGLRAFNGKAKMRKVVQMMIAMNKLQGLAESYRALDEDF